MGNLWLKIKVWTKVTLFTALSFYALLFIYNNADQEVTLWIWFRTEPRRSVLLYMLFAFLIGVIGTILVRTTVRTVEQIKELRSRSRADKMGRQQAQMQSKAGRLQTRPVAVPQGRPGIRPEARSNGKLLPPATATPTRVEPPATPAAPPRLEQRVEPPLTPAAPPPPPSNESPSNPL